MLTKSCYTYEKGKNGKCNRVPTLSENCENDPDTKSGDECETQKCGQVSLQPVPNFSLKKYYLRLTQLLERVFLFIQLFSRQAMTVIYFCFEALLMKLEDGQVIF